MICSECKKGKVVLHAFSEGACEQCGCKVTTGHIPCNKICDKCSEEKELCKECGIKITSIGQR